MKLIPDKKLKEELQAMDALRTALHDLPEDLRTQEWRMLDYKTRFRIADLKEMIYGPAKQNAA